MLTRSFAESIQLFIDCAQSVCELVRKSGEQRLLCTRLIVQLLIDCMESVRELICQVGNQRLLNTSLIVQLVV